MKNFKASLVIMGVLSSISLCSNAYAGGTKTFYNIDNVSNKRLMLDCGSGPGISSVYGGSQNYSKYYPTLGRFSSEIDSMRLMSGEMLSYSNGVFADAKVKRDRVLNGSLKTNKIMRKNQNKIGYTNEIRESTMGHYNDQQRQLKQISRDITTESIKSIKNKMNEIEIMDSDHIGTMNDVYYTCKAHWDLMSQRGYKQKETSNGDYITGPAKPEENIKKIKLNSIRGVVNSFNTQHDSLGASRRTIDDYLAPKENIQRDDGIYKTRYGNQNPELRNEQHYRNQEGGYENKYRTGTDNGKVLQQPIKPIYMPHPPQVKKEKWWGKPTPPVKKSPTIGTKDVVSENKKWWDKK